MRSCTRLASAMGLVLLHGALLIACGPPSTTPTTPPTPPTRASSEASPAPDAPAAGQPGSTLEIAGHPPSTPAAPAIAVAPGSPPARVSCPPGLAAYYRFEGDEGRVRDDCGGHHGVAETTGVTRGVPGRLGRAIQFSGGAVVVPSSPDLDFIHAGTIELWVQLGASGMSVGSTVSRGTGNNDDNVLQNSSCGNMQTIFSRRERGTTNVTSDCGSIAIGQWTHIAVVNNGDWVQLYIDGVLSKRYGGGFMGPNSRPLYMGRREQNVFPLHGAIDELKWWTIALEASDICTAAFGQWDGERCARATIAQ